jgi:hypothetical protein
LQGATGLTGAGGASGYWGSFWSTQNQTAAAINTAYPITYNNTDPDGIGVSISNSSRVNFQYTGVYSITFSVQWANTSTQIHDANIWLRKNGVNVNDTDSRWSIVEQHGGTTGRSIGTVNYVLKVLAGEYLELFWQTTNTNISLEYFGALAPAPAIPSIILTATQVMYGQLGATGATGITLTPQIDIYDLSDVWTKPAGAKQVVVECVAGGGGGGYGGKGAAGTALYGGAGGGAGGYSRVSIDAAQLTEATYTVTVGIGGNGGIGATLTNATLGTPTRFIGAVQGQLAGANAGGVVAGNGGTAAPTAGSGGAPAPNSGGIASITVTAGSGSGSNFAPTSGGAGGGLTAAAVVGSLGSPVNVFNGGSGGNNAFVGLISSGGQARSTTDGVSATPTTARTLSSLLINGGGGGGGGACSFATGSGGNGANGSGYGSGGGGGGATIGSGERSNGGNGAPGVMVITTYF